MKKQFTDSDIKKMLKELAEFVPEIDVNDTEWGAFLREFIAARPKEKLDESVAQEIRCRILQRSEELHQRKHRRIPRWLKFTAPVALGAAVCAVVIVPMLQKPDIALIKESSSPVLHNRKASRPVPILEQDMAEPVVQEEGTVLSEPEDVVITSQVLERKEETLAPEPIIQMQKPVVEVPGPEEVVITPQMVLLSEESNVLEPEEEAQSVAPTTKAMAVPSPVSPGQLIWEDVPSDADILRVATEAFEDNGFDSRGLDKSYIDKWWEEQGEMASSEFAPEIMTVIFPSANGESIRIELNVRTMEVVSIQELAK